MSLPVGFLQRIQNQFPSNSIEFLEAIHAASTLSVRLNLAKTGNRRTDLTPVPWCPTGYYLDDRPYFTNDPWFQAGAYYVQEPSSMFLWHILSTLFGGRKPETVLDLCAAPGGKSTLLASFFPPETFLVANEVVQSRAGILAENVNKWGADNVVVTNSDPRVFSRLPNFFDLILVDAPCSGEGLFRKETASMAQWSLDNANLCSQRQRRILMDAWDTLKPGGILIYSTCTFNPAENEENMVWLSSQHNVESLEISVEPGWGIDVVHYKGIVGYRFLYHRVRGEGFFVSVVQKKSESDWQTKLGKTTVGMPLPKSLGGRVKDMVTAGNQYLLKDSIINVTYDLRYLSSVLGNINIVRPGCKMATVIRDEVKPSHFLALSSNLNSDFFQKSELENFQVNQFLRRENFVLNQPSKGLYLATWKGLPVGFVNYLGNRSNTSLPQEYRILKPVPFHGESLADSLKN